MCKMAHHLSIFTQRSHFIVRLQILFPGLFHYVRHSLQGVWGNQRTTTRTKGSLPLPAHYAYPLPAEHDAIQSTVAKLKSFFISTAAVFFLSIIVIDVHVMIPMAEGPQAYSSQFWVSHYQCPQQMLLLHLHNCEVTGSLKSHASTRA